jgi:hypothetical protein
MIALQFMQAVDFERFLVGVSHQGEPGFAFVPLASAVPRSPCG